MRTSVYIFMLPHNYREPLYAEDVGSDGEPFPPGAFRATYLTLPIKMPRKVMVTTGSDMKDILAIDVLDDDGGRIRREDVQQVWKGIKQYNRDCRDKLEGREV